MKNNFAILGLMVSLFLTFGAQAQEKSQPNEKIIQEINSQIWAKFTQSYKELDGDMHASLYHPNIVRVSTSHNSVRSGVPYIDMMKRMLKMIGAKSSVGSDIQFRFNERFHNEDSAYEAGTYRMSGKGRDGKPFVNYNHFSVVLQKHEGNWVIMVDVDRPSNEAAWDSAPLRIEAPK